MRRPNGTGCVVKLGGKRRKKYAARVCSGRTIGPSGKVICQYQYIGYGETAREAQKLLDHYNGTDDTVERLKLTAPKNNPTFSKVYDETIEYLESRPKKLSESAYKAHSAAYHNLSGLHGVKFKNIDYELLQKEISKNNALSKSSLNNIKNLLRKMYNLGLKKKYVDEDISRLCDYDYKSPEEEIHAPFTGDEIRAIISDPPGDSRDMILILLFTGIRIKELLVLETSNVHLEERYFITGVKTEAGKNRVVPIHRDLIEIIRSHYDPDRFYFWDVGGSQRIYQTLRYRYDKYLGQLGISHLPHDTRHTAATLMHASGMPEMYIKLILGHQIEDITQRVYIHTKPADLVREMDNVLYI